VDRSFEGLLLSVVVHIFLVWLFFFAKFPDQNVIPPSKTEVTLIEVEPDQTKRKQFVTEPEINLKPESADLKEAAEYLSQFTKRVKKQMRATKNGPTVNAAMPTLAKRQDESQSAIKGGGQVSFQNQGDQGTLNPNAGSSEAMRTVAIGQSSIAEYIPGVQEGAFTALNTDQFTYYAFYARMNEQVRYRWVNLIRNYTSMLSNADLQRLSTRERHTYIEIILGPDGQYQGSLVHTSSGEKKLDVMPADAFEAAAPFPNPPKGMIEPDGKIHLKYAFVLQFGPPTIGPGTN
jgi:hypothetical protein